MVFGFIAIERAVKHKKLTVKNMELWPKDEETGPW